MTIALGDNRASAFVEFVDRVVELEREKKQTAAEIKAVYAEAAANEFDVRAMRRVIKLLGADVEATVDQNTSVAAYLATLAEHAADDGIRDIAQAALDEGVR